MSGYILCQVKKAGKPYFIENVSVNIYTIEELCFYLCNNLYLIDHTIRNEELSRWLEEELGLRALAAKTRSHLKATDSLGEFLYPILKEINYLDYEELRALNNRLTQMAEESSEVGKKKRADCLVANGMYVDAIQSYQEILKNEERLKPAFAAGIYHNLGCAFSYLFQKEEAVECFWKAYGKVHTESTLRIYLVAYSDCKGMEAYEKRMEELGVDPSTAERITEEIRRARRESEKKSFSVQDMDVILERMTAEYHRSTSA